MGGSCVYKRCGPQRPAYDYHLLRTTTIGFLLALSHLPLGPSDPMDAIARILQKPSTSQSDMGCVGGFWSLKAPQILERPKHESTRLAGGYEESVIDVDNRHPAQPSDISNGGKYPCASNPFFACTVSMLTADDSSYCENPCTLRGIQGLVDVGTCPGFRITLEPSI